MELRLGLLLILNWIFKTQTIDIHKECSDPKSGQTFAVGSTFPLPGCSVFTCTTGVRIPTAPRFNEFAVAVEVGCRNISDLPGIGCEILPKGTGTYPGCCNMRICINKNIIQYDISNTGGTMNKTYRYIMTNVNNNTAPRTLTNPLEMVPNDGKPVSLLKLDSKQDPDHSNAPIAFQPSPNNNWAPNNNGVPNNGAPNNNGANNNNGAANNNGAVESSDVDSPPGFEGRGSQYQQSGKDPKGADNDQDDDDYYDDDEEETVTAKLAAWATNLRKVVANTKGYLTPPTLVYQAPDEDVTEQPVQWLNPDYGDAL